MLLGLRLIFTHTLALQRPRRLQRAPQRRIALRRPHPRRLSVPEVSHARAYRSRRVCHLFQGRDHGLLLRLSSPQPPNFHL